MRHFLTALSEIDTMLDGDGRVLIAADFDGTLCPIENQPGDVRVASSMVETLRRATACKRLTMAVISGRALSDVRGRLPLDIIFAGNHGLEIAGGGLNFEHETARQLRFAIAGACEALTGLQRQWPAVWIEDKGLSATLHFRKVEPRSDYSLLFDARRCLRAFGPQLALRVGKRALEVRPKVQWDKGNALKYIRERKGPFKATICIGDDRTDESMFRVNGDHLNIRIGDAKPTGATDYLANPDEVSILIAYIATFLSIEHRLSAEPTVPRAMPPSPAGAMVAAGHDAR